MGPTRSVIAAAAMAAMLASKRCFPPARIGTAFAIRGHAGLAKSRRSTVSHRSAAVRPVEHDQASVSSSLPAASLGLALVLSARAGVALCGLASHRSAGHRRLVRCFAKGSGPDAAAEDDGPSTSVAKAGPKVAFVIGGPGSGKGTQCERIAEEFGFVHLSAGELLRAERKREGSTLGAEIEEIIQSGGVVRSEIIASLLEQAMREAGWDSAKFLIDGYPRSVEQLRGWEASLSTRVDLLCCMSIEVGHEEMRKRLLGRAETSGRLDDNAETIEKRFATYEEETGPLLEHFEAAGKLQRIDGEGSVDTVWDNVKGLLESMELGGADASAKEEEPDAPPTEDLRSFLLGKM